MNIQTNSIPLVVLDVQDAIDQPIWDGKNNPDYIIVIERLLAHWRQKNWPVLQVSLPLNIDLGLPSIESQGSPI